MQFSGSIGCANQFKGCFEEYYCILLINLLTKAHFALFLQNGAYNFSQLAVVSNIIGDTPSRCASQGDKGGVRFNADSLH